MLTSTVFSLILNPVLNSSSTRHVIICWRSQITYVDYSSLFMSTLFIKNIQVNLFTFFFFLKMSSFLCRLYWQNVIFFLKISKWKKKKSSCNIFFFLVVALIFFCMEQFVRLESIFGRMNLEKLEKKKAEHRSFRTCFIFNTDAVSFGTCGKTNNNNQGWYKC